MTPSMTIAMGLSATVLGAGYVCQAAFSRSRPKWGWWAYWGLVLPGAFAGMLAGVWCLHRNPTLLREGLVQGIIVAIGALILMDYGCFRLLRSSFRDDTPTRPLIPAACAVILGGIVILGIARSGSG